MKISDSDLSLYLEERIGLAMLDGQLNGQPAPMRAMIDIVAFWTMARRLKARIEDGPYGLFLKLDTPGGRIYVVPDATLKDGETRLEGAMHIDPGVPPGGVKA